MMILNISNLIKMLECINARQGICDFHLKRFPLKAVKNVDNLPEFA